jgi:hypothetical protein
MTANMMARCARTGLDDGVKAVALLSRAYSASKIVRVIMPQNAPLR